MGSRTNTAESKSTDKDQEQFLTEVRQTPFLEKEEAYYKLNEELEKKTSEILERIEKYSTRSRSRRCAEISDCLSVSEYGGDLSDHDCSSSLTGEKILKSSKSEHFPSNKSEKNDSSVSGRSRSFCIMTEKDELFAAVKDKHQSRLQKATESVVKCLQSKLLNYEERLTDLHLQYRQKIQENTMLESKVKALEEERERLLRSMGNLQATVDKHLKVAETSKSNLTIKTQVLGSMKKEIDDMKRNQKQSNGVIQSLQTRLHRAVEENERLKAQNRSSQLHFKEVQSEGRSRGEEQSQRIMYLEQQRSLLGTTVTKQAQLLKNLRQNRKFHEDRTSRL